MVLIRIFTIFLKGTRYRLLIHASDKIKSSTNLKRGIKESNKENEETYLFCTCGEQSSSKRKNKRKLIISINQEINTEHNEQKNKEKDETKDKYSMLKSPEIMIC